MEAITTIEDIRDKVASLKKGGKTVAFVPTMGALHEGHFSLFRLAKQHADEVVASIYVNPEQFGPDEDFDEYPRQLEADLKVCAEEGIAAVFAPSDKIMYPSKQYLHIEVDELNMHMDGGSRPGFFEGILLIVNKLFNIIEPDFAVFGQKDIQQFRILQQMVSEFNHNIELVMGSIKRANDGLALSSRNAYLDEEQRKRAPGLYRCLQYVQKQIGNGVTDVHLLLDHQRSELQAKGFKIDYLKLFSFDTMVPVNEVKNSSKYILAGAVYLGDTRLIDNLIVERP
ncbi:pantoate--beta-alanine ligase [Fodinibius salsisoli]|uniref:Pantothenate synthetase n=1 Tax=Fodinibius salsisoli TaxID=2820877 RepID=A0ABT3PHP7_9BACT|nr:pantoate--beta-alanine ligase [Fodinibius salsisoli]MCW9705430.1 pantoate--beta-alanine ligase [Fodinibius salsisoli]